MTRVSNDTRARLEDDQTADSGVSFNAAGKTEGGTGDGEPWRGATVSEKANRGRGAVMRVYLAGPFRKGDQLMNVREAVLVGVRLRRAGHVPVIPHFYCLAHFLMPMPDEFWMSWGMEELAACDCVVRLPGESVGSDAEVERAKVLGLPVFYGVEAFLDQARDNQEVR